MFGFKLSFIQNKGEGNQRLDIIKQQLINMVKSGSIFQTTDKKVVDLNLQWKNKNIDAKDNKLILGVVWKNKENSMSHMEPRWNNQCKHCTSLPWLG